MEKFQEDNKDKEDTSSSQPRKIPRREIPTGLQAKKAPTEQFTSKGYTAFSAGPSTSNKPDQPKPPLGVNPSSDARTEKDPNPPQWNRVAQRFGVQLQPAKRRNYEKPGCTKFSVKTSDPSKEDPKPLNPKPAWNKFLAPPDSEKNPPGPKSNLNFASQENEAKPEFSNVASVKEKLRSVTQKSEPKRPFSKPPLAQKPSLNKEVSQNEDTSNKSGFLQRQSGPGTNVQSRQEEKKMGDSSSSAAKAAGSHFTKTALKPAGYRSDLSKGTPKTVAENTKEKGGSAAKNVILNKTIQEESGSSHKFHKMNTAVAAGRPSGEQQEKENEGSSRLPKQKILLSTFRLSQPPQKPSRPPVVHLETFQKSCQKKSKSSLFWLSRVLAF